MSSAHDAHGDPPGARHEHDAFDGEPARTLAPGEPLTPSWVPLLGLALFACAGAIALAGSEDAGAAPPTVTPMELPAPAQVTQPAQPTPLPRPGHPSADGIRKLTPEQLEDVRKKVEDARAKGAPPAKPGPPRH